MSQESIVRVLHTTCLLLLSYWLCASIAFAQGPDVAWRTVDGCGTCFALQRNSHATAGGWVTAYDGLRQSGESNSSLINDAWVYLQGCDCGQPGTAWDIAGGMQNLFASRGYANTPVKERCRYSRHADEIGSFDDYVARIQQSLPVILTFCYDPSASRSLTSASPRATKCFSMVGIGYMYYNGHGVLICHDGLTGSQSSPAQVDRVDAAAWGLPTEGKPWGQPGTSLYSWDGKYTNLIMVFVGRPGK